MVCYLPGTGTLAVIGFAVYLVWHKAILHFLSVVGLGAEIALLLGAEAAVAVALIWTARMIRRRRAQAGACTTCRFRCQEALRGRPNLLVNRVDRRTAPAAPLRPAARTCHPAAPVFATLRRPAPGPRPAQAPRPARSPSGPAPVRLRSPSGRPPSGFGPRPARRASSRPVPAPPPASVSRPAPSSRPAPAPRPAAPAAERWPLAPRHPLRPVAGPRETVTVDGCVLTPDGVDAQPAPVAEARS